MNKDTEKNFSASGQFLSFDLIAENYFEKIDELSKNVGFSVSHFAEYKVLDLKTEHIENGLHNKEDLKILNYGCGVGLSDEHLRNHFPNAKIFCCDISPKSLEIAQKNGANLSDVVYSVCDGLTVPFDEEFDIIFISNVMRHIPRDKHRHTLDFLKNFLSDCGFMMIYEFNPFNPVSFYHYLIEDCNYDKINVKIMFQNYTKKLLKDMGYKIKSLKYRFFIPSFLKKFMKLEKYLLKCPLGACYYVIAHKD